MDRVLSGLGFSCRECNQLTEPSLSSVGVVKNPLSENTTTPPRSQEGVLDFFLGLVARTKVSCRECISCLKAIFVPGFQATSLMRCWKPTLQRR